MLTLWHLQAQGFLGLQCVYIHESIRLEMSWVEKSFNIPSPMSILTLLHRTLSEPWLFWAVVLWSSGCLLAHCGCPAPGESITPYVTGSGKTQHSRSEYWIVSQKGEKLSVTGPAHRYRSLGAAFLVGYRTERWHCPWWEMGKEDPHSPSVLGKSYCLSFS